jgi:hypothetical protein
MPIHRIINPLSSASKTKVCFFASVWYTHSMNRFHLSQILCLFWSVTLIVSCGKNIETPWEENHNKAARRFAETTPVNQLPNGPFCAADPQGNYAGDQVIIGKKGTENDISFAEGGGCILNTTAATWENLRKSEFLGWNRADLTDFHPLENPNFAFVISTSYSAGPGIFKQRWNYIGGMNNALGYKLDNLKDPQKVTTHGNYLPTVPKDVTFYVYTGDENGYQEKSFNDWKTQDLETFFGTTSNFPAHDINKGKQTSLLDKVFPKVYAHGTATDADGDDGAKPAETQEEKLTRINNMIGNVVIFVQKDAPSEQQVKDRFNNLEPLTDSTCGG